ncbi:rho guanine nucleotide exchange factor 10-like protein isoform X1 [Pomacea canaliculata]|uniref:rho guanine nucleotide exchange factor 10-like protein isoform X1 n=1 Tax=Pomacea canaliculata TaxID=400727 RepID=UPI000D72C188|nr:rho guanine nucleotide exchange factor 10-like protein isoform X1 [Pomacea canaliculata]XP_025078996.1 rho guanine nucleotide exchange factor 10-like protein isoform X1 [Pomacea canaliculata]XP_025079005.1 rho guanine nucleotide exchange factor 10-like protein isoform X1 [Pomacea canaliculata]XP_025079013.1 rho guanine nucleotide exchange factor 10-like protein isoform X1 [Pomacea canaliculata]
MGTKSPENLLESSLRSSGHFVSCKQGTPRNSGDMPQMPSPEEIEHEYTRLKYSRSRKKRVSAEHKGYNSLHNVSEEQKGGSLTEEPIYDHAWEWNSNRDRNSVTSDGGWSEGSWGSSEFEEYSDQEGYEAETEQPAPNKPLPQIPQSAETNDSLQRTKLFSWTKSSDRKLSQDDDGVCLPFVINIEKHPLPELPLQPEGLTENQKKRRCVIQLTISSERSYIQSLERILMEYKKPILELINHPKSHIRIVFKEAEEILTHHKMFQIELSETVKKWDEEERIGHIFTASFSKSMLVDAYSNYVNNFAAGMDEIRTLQQNRSYFEEFLKSKERASHDRLSIFGLMVKPIQRFPQFIMLIQDLIKCTPQSHHDRQALQLALTELENVTHRLNERKRLSEQYFQAQQTIMMLPRTMPVLSNRSSEKPRRLIRFDTFDQICGEMDNMKSSQRRVLLMNDFVICVKVGLRNQDGFMMERYRLKWASKLADLELKDSAVMPDMGGVFKMDLGRLQSLTKHFEKPDEDPFHLCADMRDMLHDLAVYGQIINLMQSRKRNYHGYGFSEDLVEEVIIDLQRQIHIKDEQLHLVNSCSVILVDNSKSDKPHYILQSSTPALKNEWCIDFIMAKLALEKQNMPGWDQAPLSGDEDLEPVPALFMKCVPVDVPRNFTKMKCATTVFMPSAAQVVGLGMQHLWVCSSNMSSGHVAVVSIHNSRPALTEAFKACECELVCCEVIPGCGGETQPRRFVFSEDTVWMANKQNDHPRFRIIIFPVSSSGGNTASREPLAVLRVPGLVTTLKFVDERLFCGLVDGAMLIYSRNDVGEWRVQSPRTLSFGRATPVRCLNVVDESLWVACGSEVHVVDIDSLNLTGRHKLGGDSDSTILQMVRCGVGVWVAYQNSPTVRLFHIENMENLQEMSIANTVRRVLEEKSAVVPSLDSMVSCLAASTGLLWIGTDTGVILALPLPRLRDGVPRYHGRPSVAYHAHRGPVRFIIPVYYSGSILQLHKNSSLRQSLFNRPSQRNLKRERIENEGLTSDVKLLSSGTDMETSLQRAESQAKEMKNQEPKSPEGMVPASANLKQSKESRPSLATSSQVQQLQGSKYVGNAAKNGTMPSAGSSHHRGWKKTRNLSFRSELAKRIKTKTLKKNQAQSLYDLRSIDPLEVDVLYKNLLEGDSNGEEEEDGYDRMSSQSEMSQSVVYEESNDSRENNSESSGYVAGSGNDMPETDNSRLELHSNSGETAGALLPLSGKASTESTSNKSKNQSVVPPIHLTIPKDQGFASSPPQSSPSSPRLSSIRAHTMRKTSTSNAVMIVSGGDGYVDIMRTQCSSKSEDACLLVWLYKF